MIGPIFEAAAKEHTELDFYKCDVDVADDVASKYQISGIPAFKFIKGGEVVKEVVGASQANLLAAIKEMK